MTCRNTIKSEALEICEQCYEAFSENEQHYNITTSKICQINLKSEEYKLQKIDIFIALKIQRNRFVFYIKQCGRVKRNDYDTYLLQQPINGSDIIHDQMEYSTYSSILQKTISVCSGSQRVYKLVKGSASHKQVLEWKR